MIESNEEHALFYKEHGAFRRSQDAKKMHVVIGEGDKQHVPYR